MVDNVWVGPDDGTRPDLIDGELSIRGVRLDRAGRDLFSEVASITQERHQALAWLAGQEQELYSNVTTDT